MLKSQQIAWASPLAFAAQVKDEQFVLLYSGVQTSYSGRYSYLAHSVREEIKAADFCELEQKLCSTEARFNNAWFGYLGYGLKNSLEKLSEDKPSWLNLPPLWMMRFGNIYVFDHDEQTVTLWSDGKSPPTQPSPARGEEEKKNDLPTAKITGSNMSDEEYLRKVENIIEHINAGDLYQANLTRKFYGEFTSSVIPDASFSHELASESEKLSDVASSAKAGKESLDTCLRRYDNKNNVDSFSLFSKLCTISPAPFSAFIKLGDVAIISSSPELFLRADEAGNISTRPIKGTKKRGQTPADDEALKAALAASEKDRAENLMIVDLMRNDLAKTCALGSVQVDALFEVTTHATIHHLSSTISGKKSPQFSTLDAVKSAFPAGSMTGAPKIRAMELCSELERDERGVYSGAIGWFGGDGSCELSVVIRTIIMRGNRFEFQVGGGIVADSTPADELEETRHKARGIMLALGCL